MITGSNIRYQGPGVDIPWSGYPRLVQLSMQRGGENSEWEDLDKVEVDSWPELHRSMQLVQDMYGNVRVTAYDSLDREYLATLYKR